MKLKTLKLKVTNEQQEYDFSEFLVSRSAIYSTTAHFEKEGDDCYWYLLITYEPPREFISSLAKVTSEGFEREVMEYTAQHTPKSTRLKNSIRTSLDRLLGVKEIEGFRILRNVGTQALTVDKEYLMGLLAIIKKYQKD